MIKINKELIVYNKDRKIGHLSFNYKHNQYTFKGLPRFYILTDEIYELHKLMEIMAMEKEFQVSHLFNKDGWYISPR